jgi:hypothetical protein
MSKEKENYHQIKLEPVPAKSEPFMKPSFSFGASGGHHIPCSPSFFTTVKRRAVRKNFYNPNYFV